MTNSQGKLYFINKPGSHGSPLHKKIQTQDYKIII